MARLFSALLSPSVNLPLKRVEGLSQGEGQVRTSAGCDELSPASLAGDAHLFAAVLVVAGSPTSNPDVDEIPVTIGQAP